MVVATATDADDPANTLTYSLSSGPAGATINATTGEISWTPSDLDGPGEFDVTVEVSDGELADQQTFTVTVVEPNTAPSFVSIPSVEATVGDQYNYDADAIDLDDDSLSFQPVSYTHLTLPTIYSV